ncbi:exported hypothetical protein [uncultured Gammaproteobacteria bacterium]
MNPLHRLVAGLGFLVLAVCVAAMPLPAKAANPRMNVQILICRLGIQCTARDADQPERAAVELLGNFPQLAGTTVRIRLYDADSRKLYPDFDQTIPLDGKGRLVATLPVFRLSTGKYGIAVAGITDTGRLLGEALVIVSRGAIKPPGLPTGPTGMPRR